MIFRKGKLLFLGLNLFLSAAAQRVVRIKTIDKETSKALDGVSVFIPKLKLTKVTDDGGNAVYINIPAGSYDIAFSQTGYEAEELQIRLPADYTDTVIIASLQQAEKTLDEVTVISTRANNRITDEPQRVEVLGQEEVNEELNIHPGNISKLLGENAGIQTQQTSAVSGNMSFRILGLSSSYTQLLKDGFPLYGGLSTGLSLLSIPPLDLQQVEIIKGASSDLYGGNAIAGVINLISKNPQQGRPSLMMMLNQTLKGGSDASAFYSYRNKQIGFTCMASGTSQQPKDMDNDVFTDLPYLRQVNISPKLFYYFNDSTKLVVGLNASYEKRKGGDIFAISDQADSVHTFIEKNISNRKYSTMLFEKHLHNGKSFSFKNSITYFRRNLTAPGVYFSGTEWNTYTEASFLKTTLHNKIVGGLNVSTDKFIEDKAVSAANLSYNHATVSAFFQDTWTISSSWTLQTGLRADNTNSYGTHFLPRLSLLYKASSHVSFRGGYGSGYNIPNALNAVAEQDNFEHVYPLPDHVKPETAASWTADVLYNSNLTEDWKISVDQAFYFTTVHHPLIPAPDSIALGKYYLINAALPVQANSMETNIRLAADDLEFLVGYTHLNIRKKDDLLQSFAALTPRNKLFFSGVYEVEEKVRCGVELDYIDRQYLSDNTQSKPYTLIGLMAQKTLGPLTLVANAENILNVKQAKFGQLYKGSLQHPVFKDLYAPLDGTEINFVIKLSL